MRKSDAEIVVAVIVVGLLTALAIGVVALKIFIFVWLIALAVAGITVLNSDTTCNLDLWLLPHAECKEAV